jgi:AraC-like DNA-binding protein
MDPLSNVLSLVRPHNYGSGALAGGGRWAFDFAAHGGIKCYVVVKGECLAVIDGVKKPVHLATGDCLMLPHGRAFRLCSDLRAPPVDARVLLTLDHASGVRTFAPGDEFFLIGGHFALEGNAQILLQVLPPFVHLRKEADRASLRGPVERIMEEMRNPQPGGSLIAQQSAYTMLVLVLRMYLAQGERGGAGWLFALANPQIARAMASMHEKPAHGWTVQSLAAEAHMSRTTFAEHFRRTVGESPMEYLIRWRMLLAGDRLLRSNDSVSEIARAVGYASESAFCAAFKRTMGASPRTYARRRSASDTRPGA